MVPLQGASLPDVVKVHSSLHLKVGRGKWGWEGAAGAGAHLKVLGNIHVKMLFHSVAARDDHTIDSGEGNSRSVVY